MTTETTIPLSEPETGWLIELPSISTPMYIALGNQIGWVQDSTRALRFARQRDAQAFLDAYHCKFPGAPLKSECKVTEHMWL